MGTKNSREASVSTTKSGFQVGAEYVERLKRYFADVASEGRPLPARGGKPNASAIALACGFDRQVLYKNPAAKELFDKAMRNSMLNALRITENSTTRSLWRVPIRATSASSSLSRRMRHCVPKGRICARGYDVSSTSRN